MKFCLDAHTHTVASSHAYSTILENARAAADAGLALLCSTDHGPAMADSPHEMHFTNYTVLDRELFGVEMLYGIELNLLDYEGSLDLPEHLLQRMDVCIAGFHPNVLAPGTKAENTRSVLAALQNPYVHILAHPEDGYVPIDFEAVVLEAQRSGVLLEVNNNSLKNGTFRLNVRENLIAMLKLCEKHGVMVSVGTDAHFAPAVGDFTCAEALLREVGFPEELVANVSVERFKACLQRKKGRV